MMGPWLRLVRWQNLLIIALTQFLVYYFLFRRLPVNQFINSIDLLAFIFCTLIIAAAGFVINDLIDLKADFVNRPFEDCLILNFIGIPSAVKFYYTTIFIGGIIALYLSLKYQFYFSFLIYPLCIYLFWIYSKYLQCASYLGNLFVAGFIASVVLIMPYLYYNELSELKLNQIDLHTQLLQRILGLSIFAFLINLFREIIKDLEDYEGDQRVGCETGCVLYGINTSLIVSRILIIFIILSTIALPNLVQWIEFTLPYIICVIVPSVIIAYQCIFPKKINYSQISILCKFYMLIGMSYLVF